MHNEHIIKLIVVKIILPIKFWIWKRNLNFTTEFGCLGVKKEYKEKVFYEITTSYG